MRALASLYSEKIIMVELVGLLQLAELVHGDALVTFGLVNLELIVFGKHFS